MAYVTSLTIGSDTFSVYSITNSSGAALTDANTYFAGSLGAAASAWTAASDTNKKKALVTAQRFIDRAVEFSGEKTSSSQPLQWPRDGASCDGESIADGTTPDGVALAEFELAGALLVSAQSLTSTGTGSNVRRVKAGSAEVEFFTPTINTETDTRIPQPAWDYVKCLVASSGFGAGEAFGSDETTAFRTCDDERSKGFA